jgi:peptide/nickel transport system substrate-binding protein
MLQKFGVAAAAAVLLASGPASAQKAKDTLRIGYQDPITTVDLVQDTKPETDLSGNGVFDSLVYYDGASRSYKGVLAESWSWTDDKTLEFKLRRGIKFHDGSEFTAADVVYTVKYLTDPASRIRYTNLDFVDHAEKIDGYTVRIVEKQATSFDLARMNMAIYPAAIHGKLADKSEFGRKTPIGTGPYRVESIDSVKGISLVRNDKYVSAGAWRPAARIGRVQVVQIPDLQTQIAQLMTGGIDLVHDVPKDQSDQLASAPNLHATAAAGLPYFYMAMDSIARSGNTALQKVEVRRALEMAVNRESLARNVVAGGDAVRVVNTLCVEIQADCPQNLDAMPPAYDVAGARKLLAEAGYPEGFDIEITSIPGAQAIAEAVAGELRKAGVRAKVDHKTFGAYREKETQGKLEILIGHFWSSGAAPNGSLEKFFGAPARDYTKDEVIAKLKAAAFGERDEAKRFEHYKKLMERVNERAYILPLTTFPSVWVSTDEVEVETGVLNSINGETVKMHWR